MSLRGVRGWVAVLEGSLGRLVCDGLRLYTRTLFTRFSSLMYRTVKSTDKGAAGLEVQMEGGMSMSTFDDKIENTNNSNLHPYNHSLHPSPPTTLQTPQRGSWSLSMESYDSSFSSQEYTPNCSTLGGIDTRVDELIETLSEKHKMLENCSRIKSPDSDTLLNLEFTLGRTSQQVDDWILKQK
ncbi:hypothetical protein L1987_44639 [Smallanthus sonchifolius]|uniref:Uncharacterized protein n=1 Tax=Smallanthus sonchifolius TaxID=185202 RepID=A0ACB9GPW0_9ASTR|nr:hypothetical protein L1987_44639 [Smallanthus sonchifolius]